MHAALTAKQAKFVAEYLVDGNGARAAVAAGYGVAGARVAACRLLTNDNVQEALQRRQTADATRLSIRRDDAIKGLLEAAEMARQMGDPAGIISAWSAVGKMLGFYAPERVQMAVAAAAAAAANGSGMMRRMQAMSDAELAAAISADAELAAA